MAEVEKKLHEVSERPNDTRPDDSKDVPDIHSSGYNRNGTCAPNYVKRILRNLPTPSERYYDIRVVSGEDRKSYFGDVEDQCLMFHSNRICLIALAPTHPVIRDDKNVTSIDYKFEGFDKIDRQANKLRGKGKKGGQKLHKNSPVCAINCDDGSRYIVTGCMTSKLIELNESLFTEPNLIKNKPLAEGFIAIIQPTNWDKMEEVRSSLPKLGEDLNVDTLPPIASCLTE